MSDRILRELVTELQHQGVQSMVLVPAERSAQLHVHQLATGGWSARLDCRRVLSDLLQSVVTNSRAGTCEVVWQGHNVVRVTITTSSARLLERVVGIVVDDHRRTSPGTRMAAILLDEDGCVPRRIEVVRPTPRPTPAARRPALSLVGRTSPA